jgi:hypothetical protein
MLHETLSEASEPFFVRRLDLNALADQLCSPDWVTADGRIRSWLGGSEPGYPYDEATALFARLFRWMGDSQRQAQCVRALERRLETEGWLSRNGIHYVFDSALALDLIEDPTLLASKIAEYLTQGWACHPISEPGRWSQSWGPHLLRCLPPLADLGYTELCEWMPTRLIESCFSEGRFRTSSSSERTYLHAHCYAIEGLLGIGGHEEVVNAASHWLAQQQQPNGSLPRWADEPTGEKPTDVVAQAVRLWSIVDHRTFAPFIARGLSWLQQVQGPSGLLHYSSTTHDQCSWANAFALQAAHWAESTPDRAAIRSLI